MRAVCSPVAVPAFPETEPVAVPMFGVVKTGELEKKEGRWRGRELPHILHGSPAAIAALAIPPTAASKASAGSRESRSRLSKARPNRSLRCAARPWSAGTSFR